MEIGLRQRSYVFDICRYWIFIDLINKVEIGGKRSSSGYNLRLKYGRDIVEIFLKPEGSVVPGEKSDWVGIGNDISGYLPAGRRVGY